MGDDWATTVPGPRPPEARPASPRGFSHNLLLDVAVCGVPPPKS